MIIREIAEYFVEKNDKDNIEDDIYVENDGLVISIEKK